MFINKNEIILSLSEKKEFFNSFYYQYKSGIPITDIFNIIANASSSKKLRDICLAVSYKIDKTGYSLKESLMPFSKAIGKAYTMLVIAGEESGKLENIIEDILKNIKKEEDIKNSLIASLTYPVCMFFFAIAVLLFFKFFVFQVFNSMAEGISPDNINFLLFSAILKILIIFVIIFSGIIFIMKNKKIKKSFINTIFNLPIFSKLMRHYYFQNFFTILALAYNAGVPMIECIDLANSSIGIKSINKKINISIQKISKGCEIIKALSSTQLFSAYAISQISSGEKSGNLDKTFKIIASDYEQKLQTSISIILKLIEPIMITFVGILVFYVAYSAYTKYYNGIFSMI